MSASKKMPARGEGVPAAPLAAKHSYSHSHSSPGHKEERPPPVFSTSMMHRNRKQSSSPGSLLARRHAPVPAPAAAAAADNTFFSSIQKASDDRENLHCGRLRRVKKCLSGEQARARESGGQGSMSALRSVIPLFSPSAPSAAATRGGQGDGSRQQRHAWSKEGGGAVTGRTGTSAAAEATSKASMSGGSSISSGGLPSAVPRGPTIGVVQQYRDAVYHLTQASTTSIVRISRDENTKELDLTNNFVKSELLPTPAFIPNQPISQYSNSRINKSPNKRHYRAPSQTMTIMTAGGES
jgi:hypothetical protein